MSYGPRSILLVTESKRFERKLDTVTSEVGTAVVSHTSTGQIPVIRK